MQEAEGTEMSLCVEYTFPFFCFRWNDVVFFFRDVSISGGCWSSCWCTLLEWQTKQYFGLTWFPSVFLFVGMFTSDQRWCSHCTSSAGKHNNDRGNAFWTTYFCLTGLLNCSWGTTQHYPTIEQLETLWRSRFTTPTTAARGIVFVGLHFRFFPISLFFGGE